MIKEAKRIPIELIVLSRYARTQRLPTYDPRALALAREAEILAPVVVRSIGNPGFPRYELLTGEESWAIAQQLLLATVPAVILDGLSEAEVKRYVEVHGRASALHRHGDRLDQGDDPLEWADTALRHLVEERKQRPGYSQKEAARTFGLDHTTLSHGLRMVRELRPVARAALRRGGITLGHAKALTAFKGTEQDRMVERILVNQASVRTTEEAAAARRTGRTASISRGVYQRDLELVRLEGLIATVTGIPVSIEYHQERKGGRVILDFADLDGFDAILDRLGVTTDES
jgi:ParB-like chromosome segregation protein Spo0J